MNNFKENVLQKFSTMQFLNFAMGFFGLQFAWQMRIILSGPVTESLGASPLIYGLIWLAGPFTGIIVQPIVGNLSDKTHTRFGRRRPYLLGGAVLASLALWIFPNSAGVANIIEKNVGHDLPVWTALLVAAIMIWVIDACINIAQGPYRALIPDTVPAEQYSIANSYISLAIGLGSVVAAGTAPILKWAINYQMPIEAQFIMGALAFSLAMLWTCLTIKEHGKKAETETETREVIDLCNLIENNREFYIPKIINNEYENWNNEKEIIKNINYKNIDYLPINNKFCCLHIRYRSWAKHRNLPKKHWKDIIAKIFPIYR